MSKFKVGDKVRVIDGGRHLNTDDRFMKAYAPNLLDKWRNGKYYDTMGRTQDVVGTVIAVGEIEKVLVSDAIGELFVIYEYGLSLEPIRREFIVIRRSGAETIAELRHDREVVKSAKATCAPSDTFDLDTGAKLAFDRLMGREEPKPAPQPAHRFKVGDRVTNVKMRFRAGEIVGIGKCGLYMYHILDDDGRDWFCSEDSITLEPAPDPEPPKFYTGKVFAVEADPCWQKSIEIIRRNGHVIEIKCGRIVGDNRGIDAFKEPYESFDNFCAKNFSTVWREVKE